MLSDDTWASQPGRVFISYRRGRDSYPATLLYDRLTAEFGQSRVFKDVDNIRPGDDFIERMTRAVTSCDALLVLIGPGWARATSKHGPGLEDDSDFVRLEVEIALSRGVRVIPVLTDDARMPAAEELPASLQPLVRRQAHQLSPTRSRRDIDELIATLNVDFAKLQGRLREKQPPVNGSPAEGDHGLSNKAAANSVRASAPISRGKRSGSLVGLAVVVVFIAAATLWAPSLVRSLSGDQETSSAGNRSALPQSAQPLPADVLLWRSERGGVSQLATLSVDGASSAELVAGGEENYAPVISRDRRTVLYLRKDDSGRKTLRAVAADGSQDRILFSDGSAHCPVLRRPAISTDEIVAMVCGRKGQSDVLMVMTIDGALIRELDQGRLGEPTFMRDGRSVVYWSNTSGGKGDGGALFEAPIDGASAPVRLTDGGDGVDADPAGSPDGLSVAFRHGPEGKRRIDVVSLDPDAIGAGINPRALTSGWSNDQDPSWSPDGSQIAFRRGPDAGSDLYVTPATGDGEAEMVSGFRQDSAPVWTSR